MQTPKILPWIARKNGISDALALKLWRRAAGEAEAATGCCNSPEYYRRAMQDFVALAQGEGRKAAAPAAAPSSAHAWSFLLWPFAGLF